MKSKIISIIIVPAISLMIILIILLPFRQKNDGLYNYPEDDRTNGYYYAVHKGTLEKIDGYNATVKKTSPIVEELPKTTKLMVTAGDIVEPNKAIYILDDIEFALQYPVQILSLEINVNGITLQYRRIDNDYLEFTVDVAAYNEIQNNCNIKIIQGNNILSSKLESKTNCGNKYYLLSERTDLTALTSETANVQIILSTMNNVTYIDNIVLNNQLSSNSFLLEVCNVHAGKDPQFYEKVITIQWYNSEYSIVTSNNLYSYEMVKL